jgi:hypothetical protein
MICGELPRDDAGLPVDVNITIEVLGNETPELDDDMIGEVDIGNVVMMLVLCINEEPRLLEASEAEKLGDDPVELTGLDDTPVVIYKLVVPVDVVGEAKMLLELVTEFVLLKDPETVDTLD